jgi:hypothetical protein
VPDWDILGPQMQRKIPMEVLNPDGSVNYDINGILKRWHDDFQGLFNRVENEVYDNEFYNLVQQMKNEFEQEMDELNLNEVSDSENDDTEDNLNIPIVQIEVEKALSNAKLGKSTGVDNLPNAVLKRNETKVLLTRFFNICFEKSIVPSIWKKAIISPIPKGRKDPRNPLNYRGISLLSTIYKLYSYILNCRLSKYLEENGLLSDTQNGFRRLRACIDHLFVICTIVRNRKSRGLCTFICFVDMKKAFDLLDRECLFYKLQVAGVKGKLYKAIASIYNDNQSCVKVNNHYTPWFNVTFGVRQGDVLSPTLFSLYINDFSQAIQESGVGVEVGESRLGVLLYADDICLIAETEEDLQILLDIADVWCRQWRMQISVEKTSVVHFRKLSKPVTQFEFKCGNTHLSIAHSYKYLGCILDQYMDFTVTANTLAGAASRALGAIISKCYRAGGITYSVYKKMYDSCVVPILDYCAGVWGFRVYDKINAVQNRCIRSFLGVHKYASNAAINGDVAWTPPVVRRKICMLKLWSRIISMGDTRLTKKVLIWDYYTRRANTWCSNIRNIFQETDQMHIYDTMSVCNEANIVIATDILSSNAVDAWKQTVLTQPKLRTYKLYKQSYETESYVQMNLSRSSRSLLAQLRSGTLPLLIETGRFINLKPEERICPLCREEPETEEHFVFKCHEYIQFRIPMLQKVYRYYSDFSDLPINSKWSIIMSDKRLINNTVSFIRRAYDFRTYKLYKSM